MLPFCAWHGIVITRPIPDESAAIGLTERPNSAVAYRDLVSILVTSLCLDGLWIHVLQAGAPTSALTAHLGFAAGGRKKGDSRY